MGFFGHETYGILVPQLGIEPASPSLEGKVLTAGPPGQSLGFSFSGFYFFKGSFRLATN